MQFSKEDAQIVLGFISSVVAPFIISYLKSCRWPDWGKLLLAVGCSLVAGVLTVYTTEGFDVGHIAVALVAIFTAAHINYKTWFTGLGLEKLLDDKGPFSPAPALPSLGPEDEHTSRIYEGTPRGR